MPVVGVRSRVGEVPDWHEWQRMGGNGGHVDRLAQHNAEVLLMSHASIRCATMLLPAALRRADV